MMSQKGLRAEKQPSSFKKIAAFDLLATGLGTAVILIVTGVLLG